jgi:hypothetical protein
MVTWRAVAEDPGFSYLMAHRVSAKALIRGEVLIHFDVVNNHPSRLRMFDRYQHLVFDFEKESFFCCTRDHFRGIDEKTGKEYDKTDFYGIVTIGERVYHRWLPSPIVTPETAHPSHQRKDIMNHYSIPDLRLIGIHSLESVWQSWKHDDFNSSLKIVLDGRCVSKMEGDKIRVDWVVDPTDAKPTTQHFSWLLDAETFAPLKKVSKRSTKEGNKVLVQFVSQELTWKDHRGVQVPVKAFCSAPDERILEGQNPDFRQLSAQFYWKRINEPAPKDFFEKHKLDVGNDKFLAAETDPEIFENLAKIQQKDAAPASR